MKNFFLFHNFIYCNIYLVYFSRKYFYIKICYKQVKKISDYSNLCNEIFINLDY